MESWKWWSRDRDVDRLLRASRAEPGEEFVQQLSERIGRSPRHRGFAVPRLVLAPALAAAAIAAFASAGGYAIASSTSSGTASHCIAGVNVPNLRWHYAGAKNGSFTSGSWSGTGSPSCPDGQITMSQGPMEGDLHLGPNDVLKGGYSFTVPGSHPALTVTLFNPQITFFWRCVNGTGSGSFVLHLSNATASIPANNSNWFLTGDQNTSYYGSTTPALAGAGGSCVGGVIRIDAPAGNPIFQGTIQVS